MKPIDFPEANATYAENQPEYLPLPAFREPDGTVTSCWQLDEEERKTISTTGLLYVTMLTHNNPLQPLLPSVEAPFKRFVPEYERLLNTLVSLWKDSPSHARTASGLLRQLLRSAGLNPDALDSNGNPRPMPTQDELTPPAPKSHPEDECPF